MPKRRPPIAVEPKDPGLGVTRLSQTFEQVDTDLPCHDGGHHDFNDGEIGQEKLTHDDIILGHPTLLQ
jgi:hypothetical protein